MCLFVSNKINVIVRDRCFDVANADRADDVDYMRPSVPHEALGNTNFVCRLMMIKQPAMRLS